MAIILSCSLLLSACTSASQTKEVKTVQPTPSYDNLETEEDKNNNNDSIRVDETSNNTNTSEFNKTNDMVETGDINSENPDIPDFYGLNDPKLLEYVENMVCSDLDTQFGDDYIVEDVNAVYISKEYLDELAYNSKSNIYFGYSLEDIEKEFSGTKYIFTLGDDGTTVVQPFEEYDDTFDQVVKNVAIGTGVILICITISVVSGGLGVPAVSAIFAASAASATEFALCSGLISTVATAVVTGYQTKDLDQAIKAATLSGSEGFKWGAMTGAVTGGALETLMLRIASSGGLTMNEVALILKEHELPARFVKQIHSMDEYNELLAIAEKGGLTLEDMAAVSTSTKYPLEIVKLFRTTEEGVIYFDQAELVSATVNDQLALVRTIDLTFESELAGKTVTNLERMRQGYAAIDPMTGEAYELHHIGQSVDSPLAILTHAEHMGGGNNTILHDVNITDGQGVHSILSDAEWAAQREKFWKAFAKTFE